MRVNPRRFSICCRRQYASPGWRESDRHATYDVAGAFSVADGAHATLRIQGESRDPPRPAFSATVEYGQLQGTTENYQEVNAQSLW